MDSIKKTDNKTSKRRFNFMDLLIVLMSLAFVTAAVYYIVSGIIGEKKSYSIAYTVRLELDAGDSDKINVGDSVLSSDGQTVIGTVRAVNVEKKTEYVIDRRVTAPKDTRTITAATTTTTVAYRNGSTENGTVDSTTAAETTATAPRQQVIIVPGKDHGTRTGALLTYSDSEDKIIMLVTVLAEVQASDSAYVVDGERVKIGKKAEFLTPYFYAVGEYEDIAASE